MEYITSANYNKLELNLSLILCYLVCHQKVYLLHNSVSDIWIQFLLLITSPSSPELSVHLCDHLEKYFRFKKKYIHLTIMKNNLQNSSVQRERYCRYVVNPESQSPLSILPVTSFILPTLSIDLALIVHKLHEKTPQAGAVIEVSAIQCNSSYILFLIHDGVCQGVP